MRRPEGLLQRFIVSFINDHDYLNSEEEQALATIIQDQNSTPQEKIDSRNALVSANYKFARSIIKSYDLSGLGLDYSDLFQSAAEGLMAAADRFEPGRGKFCTYARPWILAKVGPTVRKNLYCVKMAASTKRKVEMVLELSNAMAHATGEAVSPQYIASICEFDSQEIQTGLTANSYVSEDQVDIATYDNVEHELAIASTMQQIRDSITAFEFDLIARYFGIECRKQTSREIGDIYCISGQRVRVIVANTLEKLREIISY